METEIAFWVSKQSATFPDTGQSEAILRPPISFL
jgi:hypothetical protein